MKSTFSLLLMLLAACSGIRAPELDPVAERLENTPRHDEWFQIRYDDRIVHAYVAFPERSVPSPTILVIHENRGLTDWVRSVADRLAELGYVAVAPDFLSGAAPDGGRTKDFPSQDAARQAIHELPPSQVMSDMRAITEWARSQVFTSDEVSVAGFCWGGARAWDLANSGVALEAVYVFYGTGPDEPSEVASIRAPVYGFYGGDDARVNAGIPRTQELMDAAGVSFVPVIHPGAGHAYMRAGEAVDASAANRNAMERSWQTWSELLKKRD